MYQPSRFNVITDTDTKEVIVYNSYSGAITIFSQEEGQEVKELLRNNSSRHQLESFLLEQGYLIKDGIDEKKRATYLHQTMHRLDQLHLVIMPTEACNFRCVYCYEDFPRGKMSRNAIEGLKTLVRQQGQYLKHLTVSWYGGEPLLGFDVVEELSHSFIDSAHEFDFTYSAEMTTNGYLLSKERFEKLLNLNIKQFMVTIDGPKREHDARRKLATGEGSFEKIVSNLQSLQSVNDTFEITIRTNFDNESILEIPNFILLMKQLFRGDSRFTTYFRPVARWGGENDERLPICDRATIDEKIWDFAELAIDEGLKMSSLVAGSLQPTASVCYAAKPNSFIIASDGKVYKCTLAFTDEDNQIGFLDDTGTLHLDYDKLALWTTSGEEEDETCQACFFRPACQGNHCPYYRKMANDRPCSHEKRQIKKVLQLIGKESNE